MCQSRAAKVAVDTVSEESSSGAPSFGFITLRRVHAFFSARDGYPASRPSRRDVDDADDAMDQPTNQAPNSESSHCAGSVMKGSRLDHPKRVALERFGRGPRRIRVRRTPTAANCPFSSSLSFCS
jgi:hypothetical protein